jgi:hypothetical protein
MTFLVRTASGLVFLSGLGALRWSVAVESYVLLAAGVAIAATGLMWLLFGGGSPSRPLHHGSRLRGLAVASGIVPATDAQDD